jgi:hypothetical protein
MGEGVPWQTQDHRCSAEQTTSLSTIGVRELTRTVGREAQVFAGWAGGPSYWVAGGTESVPGDRRSVVGVYASVIDADASVIGA